MAWTNLTIPRRQGTRTVTTLDLHAAGEPLRIVTGGLPPLEGDTILARRRWMRDHHDDIRRALMWEPRGHFDMYGCVVTPPVTPDADWGVLFMHNEGYSTMCGHGIIALTTALVETGVASSAGAEVHLSFDTPAGLVRAVAHRGDDDRVTSVTFANVPSFLHTQDLAITIPGAGSLEVDVAFGGAYYALVPADRLGLTIAPEHRNALVEAGEAVKAAVNDGLRIEDPVDPDLGFVYGTIFTGPPEDPSHHSRNCCVFANGEVDRSPTGTGVSARAAQLFATGQLAPGQPIRVESILGRESVFSVQVGATTTRAGRPAIVPEVTGSAFITGRSEFILDTDDRLGAGFLLGTS